MDEQSGKSKELELRSDGWWSNRWVWNKGTGTRMRLTKRYMEPGHHDRRNSAACGFTMRSYPVKMSDYLLDTVVTLKCNALHDYYSGSEFRAVCNHCGVMAAWSRKTWTFCEQFLRFFFEKRPLTLKFSKFCSESSHFFTNRRCSVQISLNVADGKSAKSCVIILDQKQQHFGCLSNGC